MAVITAPPHHPLAVPCHGPRFLRAPVIRVAASSSSASFSSSSSSSYGTGGAGARAGVGGEIHYVSPPPPPTTPPGAPVYVTLPADAVGPGGRVARRRAMAASLAALASAGVTGVAVELWWGLVERGRPGEYDWAGYLDLAAMARRYGLRVRAILSFHQYGAGPQDPFCSAAPRTHAGLHCEVMKEQMMYEA